ncbi:MULTISPECIES: hypothetical protein [unclassified Paenibacillus]|uniref:hypothetical protein n=1 Tax=unclassified Paenibacillus TaxID=185978 RepID=UPI003684FEC9
MKKKLTLLGAVLAISIVSAQSAFAASSTSTAGQKASTTVNQSNPDASPMGQLTDTTKAAPAKESAPKPTATPTKKDKAKTPSKAPVKAPAKTDKKKSK